jgi:hypothetical protein
VEPSSVLKLLVRYMVNVYGPVWFHGKDEKIFTKGPEILFDMIQDIKEINRTSDIQIFNIVLPVLQRNAFSCLGENFLPSLLYSSNEDHRHVAVGKIQQIRSSPDQVLTPTRIPKLNFEAEDWSCSRWCRIQE